MDKSAGRNAREVCDERGSFVCLFARPASTAARPATGKEQSAGYNLIEKSTQKHTHKSTDLDHFTVRFEQHILTYAELGGFVDLEPSRQVGLDQLDVLEPAASRPSGAGPYHRLCDAASTTAPGERVSG